ncbi:MAG: hypothetical protein ACXWLJ_10480 [Rhizomicrobium sp.]
MTLKARLRRHAALALALLAFTGPATAQPNDLVDISVVNRDTGERLRTWYHAGRFYVAGTPGTRYGLRFANHTGQRVLAVVSVDGVNIITGETANYNERGYVLSPWETIDVNGWRKSQTTIADFEFAPLSGSYAARTGRPGDVGVIGMAVFEERKPLPPRPLDSEMVRPVPDMAREAPMKAPAARGLAAPPPPAAMPSPAPAERFASGQAAGAAIARADEKLGTGHGASEWSVINIVDFVRATRTPQAVTMIEYDSWDHLVAAGVIPGDLHRHPHPFPGEPRLSYVPDPPA